MLLLGDFLRKRDRVIAFRVSEEEYMALQKACLEAGTHSMSAFARDAANSVAPPCGLGAERTPSSLDGRMGKIEEALDLLTKELKRIERSLRFLANSV